MARTPTKNSFQSSRIWLLSSYILDIYKEHLLSVHLKEPSNQLVEHGSNGGATPEKGIYNQNANHEKWKGTLKSLKLRFFFPNEEHSRKSMTPTT